MVNGLPNALAWPKMPRISTMVSSTSLYRETKIQIGLQASKCDFACLSCITDGEVTLEKHAGKDSRLGTSLGRKSHTKKWTYTLVIGVTKEAFYVSNIGNADVDGRIWYKYLWTYCPLGRRLDVKRRRRQERYLLNYGVASDFLHCPHVPMQFLNYR